ALAHAVRTTNQELTVNRSKFVLPVACAAVLFAQAASASPTDEAHAYGISLFGGVNECGTSGMTHSAHTLSATAFTDQFYWYKQLLFWGTTKNVNNGSAGSDLFTDKTKAASCNCSLENDATSSGIDHANVGYMHTHGGHSTTGAGNSSF